MSQNLNGPIFDKIHRDGMGYVWEISDEATVAAAGGKVKRGEGLEYIKGADATELAANMGVDAAALAETIEAYNAAVDSGVDREIGGFPTAKLEAPFLARARRAVRDHHVRRRGSHRAGRGHPC